MKVTAWIGAGFMLMSATLYVYVTFFHHFYQDPIHPTMDWTYMFPMPFAIIAVPLMLIGGFFGKPKYYWLVALLSGIFYIMVFYPIVQHDISYFQRTGTASFRNLSRYTDFVYCIPPGLFLVIEGIILFIKRNKSVWGSK